MNIPQFLVHFFQIPSSNVHKCFFSSSFIGKWQPQCTAIVPAQLNAGRKCYVIAHYIKFFESIFSMKLFVLAKKDVNAKIKCIFDG